ncbi:MAG: transposase [Planctomycetia bacterium]|nr:transposase [Planctomycetia bacterium]
MEKIGSKLDFQKFLGIEPDDKVPDARTIWGFRERLK